ncbi:unnamed protein product [Pseudo-nitzschia multistriata]|uniref:Uncharacterized protein n=1 Tax=Pseudo-nitzschia multistriata TaxID=183589 RepID=A0A448Z946_9STRA|nr:unnamed protein product [Pseudo-nitzschia multistriata]
MRFESQDFIMSQREWQENRRAKANDHSATKQDSSLSRDGTQYNASGSGLNRKQYGYSSQTKNIARDDSRSSTQKKNAVAQHEVRQDRRDEPDSDSDSDVDSRDESTPNVPSDFSKKELQELVRSRRRQKQDQSTQVGQSQEQRQTSTYSYHGYADKFRQESLDSFVAARNKVKESNRDLGVENTRGMDCLLLCMLPTNVWLGDFLSDSRGDVEKIQKQMLLSFRGER